MSVARLDHVQLALPPGGEDRARDFYVETLGIPEIEKPANLARRGGCWFERKREFLYPLAMIACAFLMGVAQTASGQVSSGVSEAKVASPNRWEILCGSQGMLTNVTQLPSIGCFRLSLGHTAIGDFAGHVMTVSVNADGEACQVDGAAFNCSGCIDASTNGCPAMLTVHSRDPDGFINFFVSRKFAERGYVTNQENFDFEQKRLLSRLDEPKRTPSAGIAGTPIPNGPYSAWPEDSRKKAVAALSFRCTMVAAMQFGSYKGPAAAAKEMAQAVSAACVDHQMPDDWPEHAEFRDRVKHHFELAHQLDSGLEMPPDSVWSH